MVCRRCSTPKPMLNEEDDNHHNHHHHHHHYNNNYNNKWRNNNNQEWSCPNCQENNYDTRTCCRRCELPRPSDNKKTEETQEQDSDVQPKLYVGNISLDTTEEELHEYLSYFGKVANCYINNNGDRAYGFVTFRTAVGTEEAKKAKMELKGRQLTIAAANEKRYDRRHNDYQGSYSNQPRLHIGKLPPGLYHEEFMSFLGEYGDPVDTLIKEGYGFVRFATARGTKAMLENPVEFRGRLLSISKAIPRNDQGGLGKRQRGDWDNQWDNGWEQNSFNNRGSSRRGRGSNNWNQRDYGRGGRQESW